MIKMGGMDERKMDSQYFTQERSKHEVSKRSVASLGFAR